MYACMTVCVVNHLEISVTKPQVEMIPVTLNSVIYVGLLVSSRNMPPTLTYDLYLSAATERSGACQESSSPFPNWAGPTPQPLLDTSRLAAWPIHRKR